MSHIHTQPGDHDHTVSAYIIRTDFKDGPRLMVHKHKKLGKYMQFGGHIELDENPWQAIIHEVLEETGYDMSQLKIMQPVHRLPCLQGAILHPVSLYHQTHRFSDTHFHTDSAYLFVTAQPPAHQIGKQESVDIRYLSRQELVELPAEQTFESFRVPGLFAFDICLKEWEPVDPLEFS